MPKKFKKIFDIYPPKRITEIPFEKKITKKSRFRKSLIFIFFLLILGAGFAYFKLPRAKISIWPETEILGFQEKITAQTKIFQSDFSAKTIPARIFEVEEDQSQEFPATGKFLKEEKAKGEIRVYNAYSTSSQILVQNTRFISAEGKLFRSLERVTVPGGKYEGGKLVSGFLDIKIVAAEPGSDYNIGPSNFSIPGFAGTPRYTAIYGKSFTEMSGGFKGEVSQITKEDLDRSKNFLIDQLFAKAEDSIKNKLGQDFVILDMAKKREILETQSSAEAGTEANSFNLQAKVKFKLITFKKTDLEDFSKEFIRGQISKEKEIQEGSLKINFSPESIDINSGKIIVNLEFSAKIFKKINDSELKETLKGKSLEEVKTILANLPAINRTEIQFWPFWVKKTPEKIEIKVRVD